METEPAPMIARLNWTFVWFSMVVVGTRAYESWSVWSGFNLVGPLLTLMGLAGVVGVWLVPDKHGVALEHVSFGAAILAVLLENGPVLATSRYFNTDSAAFNQRATELLLKGHDPYQAIFTRGQLLLHHANSYWTYTMGGGHVARLSYPAGSFLFQAPLQLLGLHHLGTNWLDLVAWIGAAVILYLVSPPSAKWLSPLLLLASMFTFMFTFGGTDGLFVPFMMLAVWRWDDFVKPTISRWATWLGPVSLGIACSIKQTPWFIVPFLVVGIYREALYHDVPVARTVARYGAAVVATFLAINVPFIVWSPGAWWRGVLLPMTQPLVPDGQGLVSIVTHGFVHVVHPFDLQLASFLVMIALLFALYYWYPLLKRSWMFAIPLILFLPSRSLSSYLVDFIPAAFVMVVTTRRVPESRETMGSPAARRSALGVPVALAMIMIIVAFSSAPLGVRLDHYAPSADMVCMGDIQLTLANHTASPVVPHVMVLVGSDHPVGFWTPVGTPGPLTIGAHAHETVTFQPPSCVGTPRFRQSWMVYVMTNSPRALAATPVLTWRYGDRD